MANFSDKSVFEIRCLYHVVLLYFFYVALFFRDFVKWCGRLSVIEDVKNRPLSIFREAVDSLSAFFPTLESRLEAARFFASKLNITKDQVGIIYY